MNRHVSEVNGPEVRKDRDFWTHALRMRGFSLKKAFRVLSEFKSGTLKKKMIERAVESTQERMFATQLVPFIDDTDSELSQTVLASMATAFSISYLKMTELSVDLVDAKTQEDVKQIFDRYVTSIEELHVEEFAKMTFLGPDDPPIQSFSKLAAQWPFVVSNWSGLKGWLVPVHEWSERPR